MEVRTINPVLVKREREYETHPEKSDLADALWVAKVLIQRIDSVPTFSITEATEISRDIRALTKDRQTIVLEQTRLKNQLHGLLEACLDLPEATNQRHYLFDAQRKKSVLSVTDQGGCG
jgi:transposase